VVPGSSIVATLIAAPAFVMDRTGSRSEVRVVRLDYPGEMRPCLPGRIRLASMAAGLGLELEFQGELDAPGAILLRRHDTEDGT